MENLDGDSSNMDREAFRELYVQMLNEFQGPPRKPPKPPTIESLERWNVQTIVGPIPTIAGFFVHARAFLDQEADLVRSGTWGANVPNGNGIQSQDAEPSSEASSPESAVKGSGYAVTTEKVEAISPLPIDIMAAADCGSPTSASAMEPHRCIEEVLMNAELSARRATPTSPGTPLQHPLSDLSDYPAYHLLITHRCYMTPAQLLRTLLHVFLNPQIKDRMFRNQIQRRIERVIRVWINIFYDDLLLNEALPYLTAFVNRLEAGSEGGPDANLFHLVGCALKPLLNLKREDEVLNRLREHLPLRMASPSVARFNAALEALDFTQFADAILECDRYYTSALSIPVIDALVSGKLTRTNGFAKYVRGYLQYVTNLHNAVLLALEAQPTLKRRLATLKGVLRLASLLFAQGDLNGLITLCSAIFHPWVVFQSQLWEGLKSKYLVFVRKLLPLVSNANDFGGYMDHINSPDNRTAKLPFVVIHMYLASQLPRGLLQSTTARWIDVYLTFARLLHHMQMDSGMAGPRGNVDAGFLAFLGSLPSFNAMEAWERDVGLDPDGAEKMIHQFDGGNSAISRSISGSVMLLFRPYGRSRASQIGPETSPSK